MQLLGWFEFGIVSDLNQPIFLLSVYAYNSPHIPRVFLKVLHKKTSSSP